MTDGGLSRLATTATLVPFRSRVADIGTDHAALPRLLLASGRACYCVATERRERQLPRLTSAECDDVALELRWGDGLAPLRASDRLDVVVLGGMGARTILRILDDPRREELGVGRWVIQPQSEIARVRGWLASRGLGIVAERLVLDRGHFYVALAAEVRGAGIGEGWPGLDEDDLLEAGPCLLRSGDALVRRYWRFRERREERILRQARGAGRDAARRRHAQARRVLAALPESPDRRRLL